MKYIGVKLIEAEPMTRGEYNDFRGWIIPPNENPADGGYKVVYPDGYVSWCPKEQFDVAHLPLECQEGSRIMQDDIDRFVKAVECSKWGEKTTVTHVTLRNGYILTEASSCVDPANFSMECGAEICTSRIKNKVWELLGFLLQCAKGGMR
jgi:hypothetical protein